GLIAATVIVLSNLAAVAVDFFYILLAQLTGQDWIAELTTNLWINIPTTLVFIAVAAWISYRGMNATKVFQYVLVGFQVAVLLLFAIMALTSSQPNDPTPITWQMFNPAGIDTFSAFAAGISLSIFVFWGWDVTLTM
ncbi:amino acid transporter, partial [Escherichia coli]|nr:amino acid transporter [Escherichia coli]